MAWYDAQIDAGLRTSAGAWRAVGPIWEAHYVPYVFDYTKAILGANPVGVVRKLAFYTLGTSQCHASVDTRGKVLVEGVEITTGETFEAALSLYAHAEAAAIIVESHAFIDFYGHPPLDCGGRRYGLKIHGIEVRLR